RWPDPCTPGREATPVQARVKTLARVPDSGVRGRESACACEVPMNSRISRDRASLPVSQVMFAAPISVGRDAHLATARYVMRLGKQTALVVVDDREPRRPVGVLAEGDVVAAVAHGKDPNKACVAEIVMKKPLSVESATSVREAALAMLTNGVKYLP